MIGFTLASDWFMLTPTSVNNKKNQNIDEHRRQINQAF